MRVEMDSPEVVTINTVLERATRTPEWPGVLAGLYMATLRNFREDSVGKDIHEAVKVFDPLKAVFPEDHVFRVSQAEGQYLSVTTLPPDTGPSTFAREMGREIAADDAWYYKPDQLGAMGGNKPIPVFIDGRGFPWDIAPQFDENGVASFDLAIIPFDEQMNAFR